MLPDGPSDREAATDRAAFAAMADSVKWEAECKKLRAENARLQAELAEVRKDHANADAQWGRCSEALRDSEAENARLRAALVGAAWESGYLGRRLLKGPSDAEE